MHLHVEYAERRIKCGILFIVSPFSEYSKRVEVARDVRGERGGACLRGAWHPTVESTEGISQKIIHGNFRAGLPRNLG